MIFDIEDLELPNSFICYMVYTRVVINAIYTFISDKFSGFSPWLGSKSGSGSGSGSKQIISTAHVSTYLTQGRGLNH